MDCAAFRELIKRHPDTCTGSEILAFVEHADYCKECEHYLYMTEEQYKECDKDEFNRITSDAAERAVCIKAIDSEVS